MRSSPLLLVAVAGAVACGGPPAPRMPTAAIEAPSTAVETSVERVAIAKLIAKSGSTVTGSVTFRQLGDTVKVVVAIKGAAPGKHGFHVHEKGDCSAEDAKSAGGHFNPKGADHRLPPTVPRHLGDMGNVTAGAGGSGAAQLELIGVTLGAGETSIVGRAVIVHALEDVGEPPTGRAGARQACGVIELIQAE